MRQDIQAGQPDSSLHRETLCGRAGGALALRMAAIFLIGATPGSLTWGSSPKDDLLRETLKTLSDGLSTVEYEVLASGPLSPASGDEPVRMRFEVALAPGDRSAVQIAMGPEGAPHFKTDVRCDGSRRYILQYLTNDAAVLDVVRTEYLNPELPPHMDDVQWLMKPGTRQLYQLIDDGAIVSAEHDADGKAFTLLKSQLANEREMRCELDPDRDYLPRKVTLKTSSGETVFEAKTFAKSNGRWFPTSGEELQRDANGSSKKTFRVTSFRLNEPIPEARFVAPTRLEQGVLVVDGTAKDRAARNRVVGGLKARETFLARHTNGSEKAVAAPAKPPAAVPKSAVKSSALRAGREANSFPWSATLAGAGLIALIVATVMVVQRSRR